MFIISFSLCAGAEAFQQRAERRQSEPAAAKVLWEQAAVRSVYKTPRDI